VFNAVFAASFDVRGAGRVAAWIGWHVVISLKLLGVLREVVGLIE
jgi:hypothetical protein